MPTLQEKNRPGTWIYTGDPAASSKDWVRWRVGDVRADDQLTSDEEITAALSDASSNKNLAAAMVCERIAADFSREADFTINDGSGASRTNALGQRAASYLRLATTLREAAAGSSTFFVAPYAGGISIDDKTSREEDEDRTAPAFTVGMQDYDA
ncbi:MAG: hypothetical protein AB7I42_23080 [Bradyrhizobium sp.]|uniref:hypothetical protein n=1 Tax=Bradyrhizobium sp. TaxID=376 RepID=UPI003D0DC4C4